MEGLRRQKDRYLEEIQELVVVRRKTSELQGMQSQIMGLESRLNYSKKDYDNTVSEVLRVLFDYNIICCSLICCQRQRESWNILEQSYKLLR